MKFTTTILITDSNHEYFNLRLSGGCIFYDVYYTGNGPDLFFAYDPNGKGFKILSNQIDVEDYESQLPKKKETLIEESQELPF